MKSLIFFFTLLVLTSCTSFSELKSDMYMQAQSSNEKFSRESADCEMKGANKQTMGGMGGLAGIASHYESYNKVYDACMRSKGFQRAPSNPLY